MLKTLRRIIQEVNAAPDAAQALQLMATRVRESVSTDACSIFLTDHHAHEFVLLATEGLNPEAVGNIRVKLNRGLLGLVGRREEPINLAEAPAHPDFYHHPLVGEEKYQAFLGVPIIHHRRLLGVLTVQQKEMRNFDESEEAFLVTISAQLANIIAHAESSGELYNLAGFTQSDFVGFEEASLKGIPSVSGVGIGEAIIVYPPADLSAVPDRDAEDVGVEIDLFKIALKAAQTEIENLGKRLETNLPTEELALFDAYSKILASDSFTEEVVSKIKSGLWAQAALRHVIKSYVSQFEAMEDEYLRERATDFRDLGRRVLAHLQSHQPTEIDYPENTVLMGDELSAAALAEVPEGHLRAVVSTRGSRNSHVAILARALGVPTIMGAKGLPLQQAAGKNVVVDGYYGQVYVNPPESLLAEFSTLEREERELNASLETLRSEPAVTPDNHRLSLMVNMGMAADAGISFSVGAEGVGLYRSEVAFMTRDRFPAEEEQRVIYSQLLKAFAPRPVVIRTLDIGGDKALPYFPIEEDNPYLGWRGIRVTLDHPELFLVQVRAMLRAGAEAKTNLRILLPMISGVTELEEANSLIRQAHSEVVAEGAEIKLPPIGIMIEVPSAVFQARELAKRVDFVSVGTNDLTQYLLAVDRNNPRVANLYDPLHPAVLRALISVVEAVHKEGKSIGLCGEMAADPVAVILLLAMGFDSLSMNSSSLPRMKWVIRNFSMSYARKLLAEVLAMDNPALIRFHLEKAIDRAGLGGLIRAGKN